MTAGVFLLRSGQVLCDDLAQRFEASYQGTVQLSYDFFAAWVKNVLNLMLPRHAGLAILLRNRLANWCCPLQTAVSDVKADKIALQKGTLVRVSGYDEPV
jgi:hypothetical protein